MNTSPIEQLNNIIEFRQAVYENGLGNGRNALFELVDTLIEREQAGCVAEMSLSPLFRRSWSSVYAAVEEGEIDEKWLAAFFCQQVPRTGVVVYPLDGTMWPHPAARTLPGMGYGPSPTKALKRHSIVQGQEYSLLGWSPSRGPSWVPLVTLAQVSPEEGTVAAGVKQVQWLCRTRQSQAATALDVIVSDGQYGNHHFLSPLGQERCAVLVRLRRDRVLYSPPGAYKGRGELGSAG